MYNHKQIMQFIEKVNGEAQLLYDKYNPELVQRIQNQLHKDDQLFIANGACSLVRSIKGKEYSKIDIECEFVDLVRDLQFTEMYDSGFSVPYIMNKRKIIKY